MNREIKIVFGEKSKYTNFGLKGCSHGMYNRYSFEYYVYGVKGLIGLEIKKEW